MKLHVVWACPDEEYTERLLYFVRLKDESEKWKFHTFTDVKSCNQFLQHSSSIDLLVVDTAWSEQVDSENIPRTVLLSEVKGVTGSDTLYKFQPIPKLLAQLRSFGSFDRGERIVEAHDRQAKGPTKVLATYSAAGGTGKTTTAFHVLRMAKERKLRSFYFNLEMIPAAQSLDLRSAEDHFARFLYYVQSGSDELADKFHQAILRNDALDYDYIPAFHHLVNRLEFGAKPLKTVLNLIVNSGDYDLVILDLDSCLHESTVAALHESDHIIWLAADDVQCLEKTKYVIKWLDEQPDMTNMLKKTMFVLNKFTGTIANDLSFLPDIYKLPYIPQWKSVAAMLNIQSAHIFTDQLQLLLDDCFKQFQQVDGSERRGSA